MASKLSVYNGALRHLGERKLGSLSENRAPRRRMDSIWDGDTGVILCLQQGLWNFAMNTVQLTYSPSVSVPDDFGYAYAFDKPEDWLSTAIISDDGGFCNLRFDYADQGAYWFANPDTIYVKYVSKDAERGLDPSLWTPNFVNYVELYFAWQACAPATHGQDLKDRLKREFTQALTKAKARDAMDESPKQLPAGSWSMARRGGSSSGDGGSSSTLLG